MSMLILGQGDVTLVRIGEATACDPVDVTLAVGEESGHSHVIRGAARCDQGPRRLLSVPAGTRLEIAGQPWRHDAIVVPAGLYELIDHQIEYTPPGLVRVAD